MPLQILHGAYAPSQQSSRSSPFARQVQWVVDPAASGHGAPHALPLCARLSDFAPLEIAAPLGQGDAPAWDSAAQEPWSCVEPSTESVRHLLPVSIWLKALLLLWA